MMNRTPRTRPCPQCGEMTTHPFCAECYELIPADVKRTIRLQFKLGAPRNALQSGIEALAQLAAAGVPVKQRKEAA